MKILIINLHSALNLGDDGIMRATLALLRDIYPDATIAAAANDADSWQKYPEIDVTDSLCSWVADCRLGHFRRRFYLMPIYFGLLTLAVLLFRLLKIKLLFGSSSKKQLLSYYYEADLILSCGGGNFYAHRSADPALVWALFSMAFAVGLGKRTVMLPQSIGPIEGKIQRHLASWVFKWSDLIMLRESRSSDFVRTELKISKQCIEMPDMAFGLPSLISQTAPKPKEGIQIGVTVIDRAAQNHLFEQQESYEEAIEALSVKLINELGAHINIFAQCYGPSPDQDDRIVARRVFNHIHRFTDRVALFDNFQNALEIVEAYRSMDCMIGTRMHTAIFAFNSGIPAILIAYQPKAQGVMKSFGLGDYCCDIEDVTSNHLYKLLYGALQNRDSLSQQIVENYAKSKEQLLTLRRYLIG